MRKIKKLLFSGLALTLVFSAGWFASPAAAAGDVCGVDGVTYASETAALEANVEVSYEGSCQDLSSETNLEEETEYISFAGVLIEIGSTDVPTTVVVEDNSSKTHYTVAVSETTVLSGKVSLSDWIPGDQIKVTGQLNENTSTVEASVLVNLSMIPWKYDGINGWITGIDETDSTLTYTWMNREHTVRITDRTRIVAGLKNPADLADLKIGDRVRGRKFKNTDEVRIIVVLRRGSDLFMKIRTFTPLATLERLTSTVVPTTIQVSINKTPGLRANDVNNLIGTEGTLVTVNVTEDTILTRKYFGRTTLAEFSPGDQLRIVGRVNDDGTIDAKVIKNNSIWMTQVLGHVGVISSINTSESYLEVDWKPIKYLPRVKLKSVIEARSGVVTAEVAGDAKQNLKVLLSKKLQQRFDQLKAKVRKNTRIMIKRIESARIKRANVVLDDVIDVMPSRKIRVNITDRTVIRIGDNEDATINDLNVDDRILFRGIRHQGSQVVDATKIVVMPSLPEIDEDLDVLLDDMNELVEEIVDDTAEVVETDAEVLVEEITE